MGLPVLGLTRCFKTHKRFTIKGREREKMEKTLKVLVNGLVLGFDLPARKVPAASGLRRKPPPLPEER